VKTQFGVGAGKCDMGGTATKSQGNVREFYIAWRVVTVDNSQGPLANIILPFSLLSLQ